MVEAVVSYALKKVDYFLIHNVVSLLGINGKVQWLQTELRLLQSYLKDAEQKQGSDALIRTWISELQDIAYDTEDIIETFIFKANKESIHSSTWERMGDSVSNFVHRCGIGDDIENLKNRVLEIKQQRETHGINNLRITQNNETRSSSGDLRLITFYGSGDVDVVGFKDVFRDLNAKLVDDNQSRRVISILGMGGLGKTTLAKQLYNNKKKDFELHARICVSQEWKTQEQKTEDLLRILIKSFDKQRIKKLDKMKLIDLLTYFSIPLEGHPYLLVIDDLWHGEAWKIINNALPDNDKKSRIIITSRKEDVAPLSNDGVTDVHKLRFLTDEESWSLFCKKAFPNKNGVCPDSFQTLGKEMTAKCGGLPLAIIALGGLLSQKEIDEWKTVKEHIWREVKKDSDITPLLDLSYNDLSVDLKLCFLYLCIFPDDALIEVEELVKLWVAEGFIPIDEEGSTPEEVSKGYFKELLKRNLVQTVEENWSMTSSCRVHGLLRYLALTKARETNFLRVYDHIGSSSSLPTTSCRRLAVHSGFASEEFLNRLHKKVRTLYLLNDEGFSYYSENIWKLCSFSLLRVLQLERVDLRGERKSSFFNVVEKMIHLRYFGLKNTNVNKLPNSIVNLEVLQTLNLESNASFTPITLPDEICKLKELRHLMGRFWKEDFPDLKGLGNLQTLELMIRSKRSIESDFDSNVLAKQNNLRTLRIELSAEIKISIMPLLNCKHLIELKITGGGKVREVPQNIHEHLKELKYLELFLSESEEDPIPKLEMLPYLLALHLSYDVNKTIRWTFTANGFPQLKFLKLGNASNMDLSIEEGAMPNLQFLCLENDVLKQTLFPEKLRSLPGEEAMNWKFNEY